MNFMTEFDGLPDKLKEWGMDAISKIESPEKRHKAAKEIRQHIDQMWEDSMQLDETRRIHFILDNLGEVTYVSEQLKKEEQDNPRAKRKYLIFATISILIGVVCCAYALSIFMGKQDPGAAQAFALWRTGAAAGSGLGVGIVLLVVGIKTLIVAK